jgi:hypothetical protein
MTGGFPVGTVCIGQNFVGQTERNGDECVVVRSLQMTTGFLSGTFQLVTQMGYKVQWADGQIVNVAPQNLRRKQPPSGELAILRMFDATAPAPREVEAA